LATYKLDLLGVQEVRWDKGGTVRAGDYNFPKHHVKIMLGDLNIKVGRENIFKTTIQMTVNIRIVIIMVLE
jgi:hypothetical protein